LCELPLQRRLLLLQLLVPLPDSYSVGVLIERGVSPEFFGFFAFGEGLLELGYAVCGFLEGGAELGELVFFGGCCVDGVML
jgi:hypothetical protein